MKRYQYLLGAFIFFVIGGLVGWSLPRVASVGTSPAVSGVSGQASGVASFMFDEGDGTVKSFEQQSFTEGDSLFDVTKKIAEANHLTFKNDPPGKYGILITEMDSKKNGDGKKYWGYWVNDHMGEVSADNYKLQSHDVILWRFGTLKF